MREIEVKKRDWVKNAAIIFLAVMLILTFFSNTIMNRSLPEVAAQYTQAGTITTRIRGSGSVTANEVYRVQISQSYKVERRHVKEGDEVKTGDVLITFDDSDSKELEELEDQLLKAERELEEFLVTDSPDNYYAPLNRNIRNAETRLEEAKINLAKAEEELVKAGEELESFRFDEERFRQALSDTAEAQKRVEDRERSLETAKRNLEIYEWDVNLDPSVYDSAYEQELRNAIIEAEISLREAENRLNRVENRTPFEATGPAQTLHNEAEAKVAAAESAVTAAEDEVKSAQKALDEANYALADQKHLDGRVNTIFDYRVSTRERDIKELRERIEKLRAEGTVTEITAPVSGKITQVNVGVGDTTEPDEILMLIEVVDRGYTLSIPVTALQSSKVNIGDTAEVDRGWWSWGDPINAVLTGIRPDPQNPGSGRLLIFNVSGDDIESDTTLNITIAQRSENYGIVVPNSAIRSDSNGDFILIVETRSSPLRNRYIVRRVDVTVIASDDTNSAISGGGLTGWDFVITTSTRPIEPGMQIRLADNP